MEKYQVPELEFVKISAKDVITVSGNLDNNIDELPDDEW